MPGEDGTVISAFRPPPTPGPGLRGPLGSSAGPSSAVVSRAWWRDEVSLQGSIGPLLPGAGRIPLQIPLVTLTPSLTP